MTPDINFTPSQNKWQLGPNADQAVANTLPVVEKIGTEFRWNVDDLGLIQGHSYRFYVISHDGDHNSDTGQACLNYSTDPAFSPHAIVTAGTATVSGNKLTVSLTNSGSAAAAIADISVSWPVGTNGALTQIQLGARRCTTYPTQPAQPRSPPRPSRIQTWRTGRLTPASARTWFWCSRTPAVSRVTRSTLTSRTVPLWT